MRKNSDVTITGVGGARVTCVEQILGNVSIDGNCLKILLHIIPNPIK